MGSNSEYHREYYQKNKQKYVEKQRRKREKNRDFVDKIKEASACAVCGEDEPVCLDFHHLSDKDLKLADAVRCWGITRLQREIDKCVILYSNCHRKVHAGKVAIGLYSISA